jgi:Spy/CpxP family protein refolding chaperone
MVSLKIRPLVVLSATLFFSQNVLASTGLDAIGTGSAGSYSHGKSKGEGSKTKKTPHISGSTKHYKKEGSGNKSYSHSGKSNTHSYSHKKPEGSASNHHTNSGHSYGKKSGHGGHTSKSPFTHLLRFKEKLGLTKGQVTEIKQLRFAYGKQSIRNKAEHKIAHMEFDKQVHAENLDENAVRLAAGEIARTKTDKIMAMANAKIALLKLLTEEQREKAHTMHSAHSSH